MGIIQRGKSADGVKGWWTLNSLNPLTISHINGKETFLVQKPVTQAGIAPGLNACFFTSDSTELWRLVLIPNETPVLLMSSIVELSCGWQHCAAIDSNGLVFSWGMGLYGELGHGDCISRVAPTLVEALEGIECVKVSCGFWSTAVVSSIGDVYVFGSNQYSQLALSSSQINLSPIPLLVEHQALEHEHVVQVESGSRHIVVLTKRGKLFGWGWNRFQQLGDDMDEVICFPRLLTNSRVLKVSTDRWSTSFVTESEQQT